MSNIAFDENIPTISTLYCDTILRHASLHQPVSNFLVSGSLLQFEVVKEGPKSRIGALYQGFEPQDDLGNPARAESC